jgi:hypothetical protein
MGLFELNSDSAHLFGHLAYILIFFSFLVKKIVYLRLLAIFASMASIYYSLNVSGGPLWVQTQWNSLFILTNIGHICLFLWEKRNTMLGEHHGVLHQTFFNDLTSGEYLKMAKLGHLRTSGKDEVLVEENSHVGMLFIIYEGAVSLKCSGQEFMTIEQGHFIGEMSYLTGEETKAEVQAIGEVKYFFWPKDKLKEFLAKSPRHMASMQRAIGGQLIAAILHDSQKKNQSRDAKAA